MRDLATVLNDVEPEQVKEFCRGLLKDESTSTKPEQEQAESENETTPAGTTQFVFVGAHDQPWPESHGTSSRERDIARRKEQSDA
jgi:hypothetical protein